MTTRKEISDRKERTVTSVEDAMADKHGIAGSAFGVFKRAERSRDESSLDGGQPTAGPVKITTVLADEEASHHADQYNERHPAPNCSACC